MEIEVKDLSKLYIKSGRRIQVIDHFSYRFKQGKLYLIQGESGKGKTTLLTMIGLLQDSDSGEILYNGQKCNNIGREKQCSIRRENVGVVFQDFNLFENISVIDNVTLVWECLNKKERQAVREKAEKMLMQFGLGERAGHNPNELSGGEKQRVGLVRAIFNEPAVLICEWGNAV